jgi:hypothetical protein
MTEKSIVIDVAEIVSSSASNDDPKESAAMFAALVKRLYRERKDVTAMIAAGEAGVKFCLEAAEGATDEILAKDLKTSAKTIAYNTAANCWPGWGDEGVVIEPGDLKSGLALACLSHTLVRDLGLGHEAIGKAHWLVGALMLADRQFVDAIGEFQQAENAFQASGDASCVLLVRGYAAMARRFDSAPGPAADRALADTLDALRQDGSKQAIFFANQIVTAERVLFG